MLTGEEKVKKTDNTLIHHNSFSDNSSSITHNPESGMRTVTLAHAGARAQRRHSPNERSLWPLALAAPVVQLQLSCPGQKS